MALKEASIIKLSTCHEDLIKLFTRVSEQVPMLVIEGHRSLERQKELFAKGASKTMKSRHLPTPSEAVDVAPIVNGTLDWADIEAFKRLAGVVKATAKSLGIEVEWGGDWKSFKDYPHWQLKEKK